MTRILGIDPGSLRTGVGIVDAEAGGQARHVFHTALAVGDAENFPLRLKRIFDGLTAIVETHRPDEVAIERVFLARNPDSALKLGQARGAALCAVLTRALEVHEYTPMEIKRAVVGSGAADKTQVQHMVRVLLGLDATPQADAADALAVAITHAHVRSSVVRLGVARSAWRTRR